MTEEEAEAFKEEVAAVGKKKESAFADMAEANQSGKGVMGLPKQKPKEEGVNPSETYQASFDS